MMVARRLGNHNPEPAVHIRASLLANLAAFTHNSSFNASGNLCASSGSGFLRSV